MTTQYPARVILADVPRIGFDIHMCPFPGALFALLKYIGDPCDYDYLMGVTGAAFRRLWNRDDGGNVDLSYFGDAPFQRVFDALGYEWRSCPIEQQAMLAGIKESLSRGVPAISFGIIGPPEAGLVTGYDRDGETLFGWSYFQEQRENCYEKSGWFQRWSGRLTWGTFPIALKSPTTSAGWQLTMPGRMPWKWTPITRRMIPRPWSGAPWCTATSAPCCGNATTRPAFCAMRRLNYKRRRETLA